MNNISGNGLASSGLVELIEILNSPLIENLTPEEYINKTLPLLSASCNTSGAVIFLLNHESYVFEFFISLIPDHKEWLIREFQQLIKAGEIARLLGSEKNYISTVIEYGDDVHLDVLLLKSISMDYPELLCLLYGEKGSFDNVFGDPGLQILAGIFEIGWKITKRFSELLKPESAQYTADEGSPELSAIKELHQIIDNVQTGIILVDVSTGEISDANKLACELFGIPRYKLIGKKRNNFFLFNPTDKLECGNIIDKEIQLYRSNGKFITVNFTSVKISLGESECYLESFYDLSRKKKREEELWGQNLSLRQKLHFQSAELNEAYNTLEEQIVERVIDVDEKARFVNAFHQSPEGMVILTHEWRIKHANIAFAKIFNENPNLLTGSNVDNCLKGLLDTQTKTEIEIALAQGTTWQCEYQVFQEATDPHWYTLSFSGITGVTGSNEILFSMKDITVDKAARETLILAKNKAEESDRFKSTLMENLSHELRTPLVSIIGFAQLFETEAQDPEKRRLLSHIRLSGIRLLNTLNQILLLSELKSGFLIPKNEPVNINLLTAVVKSKYQDEANFKGLRLFDSFQTDPLIIYSDAELIIEICSAIVENAVKFTMKGEIEISTSKKKEFDRDFAVIMVRDTGIGMRQDKLDQVFEAFRQVSEGINRDFEGTGLGLTVAKEAATLLGGLISVESTPGVGSIFTVVIPVRRETEKRKNI